MADDLRARIDAAIRPNLLIGLQDAELHDEPGKERINEWADWISRRIAELVQPELDELRGKVTALEASYEVVAADAMAHGLCSLTRNSLLQRAERAEAALAMVAPEPNAEHPDRCPRCWCGDCGGRLDEHTEDGCACEACEPSPFLGPMACSLAEFAPDERIGFIAEQLGPLLSSHLNERARLRCLAVAHAAHHALHDYDSKETPS